MTDAWEYGLDETETPTFCCAKSAACDFIGTAVEMDVHYGTAHQAVMVLPASPFAPQGAWIAEAACRATDDPTIFDALDAEDIVLLADTAEHARRQREAAGICAGCPVQAECLRDAVDNDLTGVRGGVLITSRGKQYDLVALAAAGKLRTPAGIGRPPQIARPAA